MLVGIQGMATWPGREPALRVLGKATRNMSANAMTWEIFVKHPMR
jgi:hypothetical protein